jgi:putative PIN family toxin of toxin-antitoxin system
MNEAAKPVVIFDTGCVLQAAINPAGPAADAIDILDQDRITVYTSPRLRSEYEAILTRPAIRAKNLLMTDAQVEAGLARFDTKTAMVPNPPPYVNYPRDPDDEHVINLAIYVEADYIVTRDKDLLALMDIRQSEGRFFRKRFSRLTILSPVDFLQAMREKQREPDEA